MTGSAALEHGDTMQLDHVAQGGEGGGHGHEVLHQQHAGANSVMQS